VEAGLRQWLSESHERRLAFELVTDTWDTAAQLPRRPFEGVLNQHRSGFRRGFSRPALAAGALAAVAMASLLFYLHRESISTEVGEQRILSLQDGTRVYLNSGTELVDRYDERVRRVDLRKGEALFDVARRSDRPFVVIAGDREIRALGTQFVVRREAESLAVTLLEGKVKVTPTAQSAASVRQLAAHPWPLRRSADLPGITLSPGQRLTFEEHEPPKTDMPALERVTAWQRGQVVLDNTPLANAVAEMNRYSTRQLVVQEPLSASIHVSGRFRTGDQEDFAHAIAKAYGLSVRMQSQEIVIAGVPDTSHSVP